MRTWTVRSEPDPCSVLASGLGQIMRERFHFTSEDTALSLPFQRKGLPNLLLQFLNEKVSESGRMGSYTSWLFLEFLFAQTPVGWREGSPGDPAQGG